MNNFFEDIKKFNDMYSLPNSERLNWLSSERLKNFKSILSEEVEEVDEIVEMMDQNADKLEVYTAISDWLGDMIVYCASEARRWGIPMNEVLDKIMESNFSKLGSDGKVIMDERGKVLKGPNFMPPEPMIKDSIKNLL